MIEVGDKLVARFGFLIRMNIPVDKREFRVIEFMGKYKQYYDMKIESIVDTSISIVGSFDIENDFHLTDSINQELIKMIENDGIKFKSFQGITIDNKIVQVDIGGN